MASQFASTHRSNPFFYPNTWIGTGPKQHMNKSIALYENESDDMHNASFQHEDGQVILEYDPTWQDTTNSNENELDSSDNNDEYMKPTCNDLDPRLGYASFDDHNEAHSIDDEPIEVHHFQEEFYDPPKVSPKRTNVRR